jgi:hypothetical protein
MFDSRQTPGRDSHHTKGTSDCGAPRAQSSRCLALLERFMTRQIKVTARSHLAETLDSLSKIPKPKMDGYHGIPAKFEGHTFELFYGLRFTPSIDDHIKDAAVWHVINECARSKNFSVEFFIRQLRDTVLELRQWGP